MLPDAAILANCSFLGKLCKTYLFNCQPCSRARSKNIAPGFRVFTDPWQTYLPYNDILYLGFLEGLWPRCLGWPCVVLPSLSALVPGGPPGCRTRPGGSLQLRELDG